MSFQYKPSGKAFNLPLLIRVIKVIAEKKWIFFIAFLFTLCSAIIAPTIPRLIQYAIDNYIQNQNKQGLYIFCLVIFGLMLLQAIISYQQSFLTNFLGQTAVKRLRLSVFDRILNMRLSIYDKTPIGTMITRTVSDVESVSDIFSQGIINLLGDFLQMIIILTFMFYQDWKLSCVALSVMPLLFIASYFFKEAVKNAFQEVRNQVSKMNAYLQEHITGVSIIQVYGIENEVANNFEKLNAEHRDANIKSIFAYSVFFPVIEVVSAMAIALIVWSGAGRVLEGEISFGLVVSFTLYINLLFRPLRTIADRFNTLQMGILSADRIFQVLDMQEETPDKGSIITPINGNIRFENVSFGYDENQPVIKNISFEVQEGKTIAIVGHTGSGKSTIISLLNRFYPPSQGSIFIDNQTIEQYPIAYLRSQIGYVLQDVFLLSDTIFNNIKLFNDNITDKQVIQAAEMINANQFIEQLPNGYNHIVSERGASLSTGQRQLISFIRALVHQPKILVMDEATANIDHRSEELIQTAVQKMLKGRTNIVIAHRLSTIRQADEIIVLDKGQIKERGSHDSLLDLNGLYKKLYEFQFKELEFKK